MKKLLTILFIVCLVLPGFSQLKPTDLVGKWKFVVETGNDNYNARFNFFINDNTLKGEVLTPEGDKLPFSKLEIKEENKVYIEIKAEYDTYKVDIKVEGDKFAGTASSYEGEAPISGKKEE